VANLFDATNAPSIEPDQFVAGDLVQWKREDLLTDYPTALYTLKYSARLHGQANVEIELTADANHLISVGSTVSSKYRPGTYSYQAYIIRNSDSARVVVRSGRFIVAPNRDKDSVEPRTVAEVNLQKCSDVYSGRMGSDVESYSIAGRSLSKLAPDALRKEMSYWQGIVNQEQNKAAIKAGKASTTTIKARFL
tara:strand:+ start:1017 stop:1595 length:579 start_codon:yes stop_codon:yes gene_type:complete